MMKTKDAGRRILKNQAFWYKNGRIVFMYVFLIVVILIMGALEPDTFFTVRNFNNLLKTALPLIFVAMGQTFVMLTGGIDLSLGSLLSVCQVVCVVLMKPDEPYGFVIPILAAMGCGILGGCLNGLIVTKGRLAPIIVTLATTAVFDGAALLVLPIPGGKVHRAFGKFLTTYPVPLVLILAAVVILTVVMNKTAFSKAVRSLGGNENSAYSVGINVERVKMKVYILAGLLSSVGGIFLAGKLYSGDPTIGQNYSMNSVTATVVGGTLLTGAVGNVVGTIAGAMMVVLITNVLNLLGISSFYQFICQGAILILALALGSIKKKKNGSIS